MARWNNRYATDPFDQSREYSLWAPRGFRIRLGNFDGSSVTPYRCLFGHGPVNLLETYEGRGLLMPGGNAASFLITRGYRDGSVDRQRYIVNLSPFMADLQSMEVSQIKTALEQNCTPALAPNFQIEVLNNVRGISCLNLKNNPLENPDVVEISVFGAFAGAIHFGGGKAFTSYGTFPIYWFDDTMNGATRTPISGESSTAQQTGGYKSTQTSMTLPADYQGVDYAFNSIKMSAYMEQILFGRKLSFNEDNTPNMEPLLDQDRPTSAIEMHIFADKHLPAKGNTLNDIRGVVFDHIEGAQITGPTFTQSDVNFTTMAFTVQSRAYIDATGATITQPKTKHVNIDYELLRVFGEESKLDHAYLNSILNIIPATNFITPATMAYPANTNNIPPDGQGQCSISPANASGYIVTVQEPTTGALGVTFAWDDINKRILVTDTLAAGTETLTIRLNNADGTTLTSNTVLTVS